MHWLKNRLVKWSILLLFCFVILISLAWVFIPSIVSTDLVKQRFELVISETIGQKVTFNTEPKITLWPNAKISLGAVTVGKTEISTEESLLIADSVSADMSLFSALFGEPSFSNYKLVRPTVQLEIYPDGTSNWLPTSNILGGLLNSNVSTQTTNLIVSASTEGPFDSNLFDFQNLEIEGGTVLLITDPGNEPEKISSINGRITRSSFTNTLTTNFEAIVRGEKINLNIVDLDTVNLIHGEVVDTNITLKSDLVNFSYNGEIQAGNKVFLKGELALNTPSVRRAIEWSGSEIKPGAALGAVDLQADVSGTLTGAKFEDLIVKIGDNRGIGILDYSLEDDGPPVLSGTLAFNTLDIESFLRAFTPLPKSSDDIANTIDTRFLKQLGLDLRLSAQSAKFGPVEMSNLAAAVKVNREDATFNVGDATAYGGQLIGKISISDKGIDGGGEISISVRAVDFDEFFTTLELEGPLPRGTGDLDLKLTSERPLWATDVANIRGGLSITLNDGSVPGVNLDQIKQLASEKKFFGLNDAANGSLSFDMAELDVDIDGGIASIQQAIIMSGDEQIILNGIIPFAKGSFALQGSVSPIASQTGQTSSESPKPTDNVFLFFIGGSWPNPIVSPSVPAVKFR
jgi:AsmA protein